MDISKLVEDGAGLCERLEKRAAFWERYWTGRSLQDPDSGPIREAAALIRSLSLRVEAEKRAREEAGRERDRLRDVIERDRTKTAEIIGGIRAVVGRWSWLGEGRGSYAWDDDRYQDEFRQMLDALKEATDPLRALAADWTDCPQDYQAARIDWKAYSAALARAQGYCKDAKHAESVADELRRLLEKEKERADKFMWQVRDTCARAEAAEAHSAELAKVLENILDTYRRVYYMPKPGDGKLMWKAIDEARSLLAPKEDTANG